MVSRNFFVIFFFGFFFWLILLSQIGGSEQRAYSSKELVVLSYSSFLQPWGPGPWIKQEFKKTHGIDIHWIDAGNAGLILERLRFKFGVDKPDIVLGLDQLALSEARETIQWKQLDSSGLMQNLADNLPPSSIVNGFLPFDWSPMVLVTRRSEDSLPESLADLTDSNFKGKIALQDPRTSSPGLQFLFWVLLQKGEKEGFEYLSSLRASIHSFSPSWSTAYSLFKSGHAKYVFSYISSPLYHLIEEKDSDYQALLFPEGHPIQLEYVGIPHLCRNCNTANKFVEFLHSKEVQGHIMRKNYMWPVVKGVRKGTAFDIAHDIKIMDSDRQKLLIKEKRKFLSIWKSLFQ